MAFFVSDDHERSQQDVIRWLACSFASTCCVQQVVGLHHEGEVEHGESSMDTGRRYRAAVPHLPVRVSTDSAIIDVLVR